MGVNLVSHPKGRTWLRVSGNKVLRKIFGEEIIGRWRNLYNEELHNLGG
jgi:hypothetical protein